ncbi:MAG TPA: acyltransferase [Rhizomicrobium sp.]|nr:acyltransferase [Rhizomicrobium sp.]
MKTEIKALTGLRFIASYSIVLAHFWSIVTFGDAPRFNATYLSFAFFGMSLFFTLSGFVIYYNYADAFHRRSFGEALRSFAVARFARIYPLFIFFFGVAAAMLRPNLYNEGMILDLPLLQSWVPPSGDTMPIQRFGYMAHSWSISTEFFFYAAFPILCFTILREPRSLKAAWLGFILLIIGAFAVLYAFYTVDLGYWLAPTAPHGRYWLVYFSPYTRILEFIIGAASARLVLAAGRCSVTATEHRAMTAIAIPCLAGLAWLFYWTRFYDPENYQTFLRFARVGLLHAPMFAFLMFYVSRYQSTLQRILSWPPLVAGGEISYSIYLLHIFFGASFLEVTVPWSAGSLVFWVARMALLSIWIICLATGLYLTIEVPCRRWIRAALGSRPKVPALVAVPAE